MLFGNLVYITILLLLLVAFIFIGVQVATSPSILRHSRSEALSVPLWTVRSLSLVVQEWPRRRRRRPNRSWSRKCSRRRSSMLSNWFKIQNSIDQDDLLNTVNFRISTTIIRRLSMTRMQMQYCAHLLTVMVSLAYVVSITGTFCSSYLANLVRTKVCSRLKSIRSSNVPYSITIHYHSVEFAEKFSKGFHFLAESPILSFRSAAISSRYSNSKSPTGYYCWVRCTYTWTIA
jgi:hypothetical protein